MSARPCPRCGTLYESAQSYCNPCKAALEQERYAEKRQSASFDAETGTITCSVGGKLRYRIRLKDPAHAPAVIVQVNRKGYRFPQGVVNRAKIGLARGKPVPTYNIRPPDLDAERVAFYEYKTDQVVRAERVDGRWQVVAQQSAPETDGELRRLLAGFRAEGYEIIEDYQIEV